MVHPEFSGKSFFATVLNVSSDGRSVFSTTTYSFSDVSVVSVTHDGFGISGAKRGALWGLVENQYPTPGLFDFIESVGALPVYAGTSLVNGVQTRVFTFTPVSAGPTNGTVYTVYYDSASHHPVRITISNPTTAMTIIDISNFSVAQFADGYFKWTGPLPADTTAYNASIVAPQLGPDIYPSDGSRSVVAPTPLSMNQSAGGRRLLQTCTNSGGQSYGCSVGWTCKPLAGTTGTCKQSSGRKLLLDGSLSYAGSWNLACTDSTCSAVDLIDVTGVTMTTYTEWVGRSVTTNLATDVLYNYWPGEVRMGVFGQNQVTSLTQTSQQLSIRSWFGFYPNGWRDIWGMTPNMPPGSVNWWVFYDYWLNLAGHIPIHVATEQTDIMSANSHNSFNTQSPPSVPITSCGLQYTATNGGYTSCFVAASGAVGGVITVGTTNMDDPTDMYSLSPKASCTGDSYLWLMSGTTVLATFDDFGSTLCSYGTHTFTTAVPYGSLSIRQGCWSTTSCTGQTSYSITYLPSTLAPTTATPSFAGSARVLQTYSVQATVLAGSVINFGTAYLAGGRCTGSTYLSLLSNGASVATAPSNAAQLGGCSYGSYTATSATAYTTFTIQAGCSSTASCSGAVGYMVTAPASSG